MTDDFDTKLPLFRVLCAGISEADMKFIFAMGFYDGTQAHFDTVTARMPEKSDDG